MLALRPDFQLLSLVAALAPSVLADVEFIQPAAGTQMRAEAVPAVVWQESGIAPPLTELAGYVLNLCAGGNTKGSYMCPLAVLKADGTFAGTTTATELTAISPAIGENSPNGYFLQMESTTTSGGKVYNYSPRFGLTGMKGSFTPQVQAGITAVGSSTQGPARSKQGAAENDAVTKSVVVDQASYAIPYPQQEGAIKYAPMQPQPPRHITAQQATPQYPTSAVTIARTGLPAPNVRTTMTQSQTHSVVSRENPASPAPDPDDHMAKWLARWKD